MFWTTDNGGIPEMEWEKFQKKKCKISWAFTDSAIDGLEWIREQLKEGRSYLILCPIYGTKENWDVQIGNTETIKWSSQF